MRTASDAIRSLKKYTSLALGDEWEVRMTDEEGAFKRPFARVSPAAPARHQMHGARHRKITQRAVVVAYPEEKSTADLAIMEATRVTELLQFAFVGPGLMVNGYRPSTGRGHPMRLPLWDYEGIALDQPATDAERATNDFMRLEDEPVIGPLRDTDDELLWVVTADFQVSWTASVAVDINGLPVERVTAEYGGP